MEERILPEDLTWKAIVETTSFESARIESAHCLETLSLRLHSEIVNINDKIAAFNLHLSRALTSEFQLIKEKIAAIFENAFKESDRYIKEYSRWKEQQMTAELVAMREHLEKETLRIEAMKGELSKPTWKKVAGEILATDFEKQIEEEIKKSSEIKVGELKLGDLGTHRLKNIESELKELLRLKT